MHSGRLKPHFAPPFCPVVDRPAAKTVPVIGIRQARNYSCGFASALMVLRSFGHSPEAKELFDGLGTGRGGTRQNAIVRELRRRQISANVRYDFTFDKLTRTVDAGKLVIGYLGDAEHWLVLFGYERDPDRVFVADPRPGEDVEHLWEAYGTRLGSFGIVCSPRRVTASVAAPVRVESQPSRPNPSRPRVARTATSARKFVLPPREQLTLPHCQ